jgi:hypothetical protein
VTAVEIIEGTLKPDGSLELDEQPKLAPGRVKVVLQPVSPAPVPGGLAEALDKIHADQRARGFVGQTADEIEAALHEGEEDYERRMELLRSQCRSEDP